MHHSMRMAICCCLKNLVCEFLNQIGRKWSSNLLPNVFLEIILTVLENEVQLILLVYHFFQPIFLLVINLINTYSTTFGCLTPLRRDISLILVLGTPSSSFSNFIFFRATTYIINQLLKTSIFSGSKNFRLVFSHFSEFLLLKSQLIFRFEEITYLSSFFIFSFVHDTIGALSQDV